MKETTNMSNVSANQRQWEAPLTPLAAQLL